jgi:hypothetical protein
MRFATPSSQWTSTTYSLPVSTGAPKILSFAHREDGFRPNLVVPRLGSDSPKQSFKEWGRRLQSAHPDHSEAPVRFLKADISHFRQLYCVAITCIAPAAEAALRLDSGAGRPTAAARDAALVSQRAERVVS